jgi:hypothetical protein
MSFSARRIAGLGILVAALTAVLPGCRSLPANQRPYDRIDYSKLRPVSIASIREGQAPTATLVTWINPSIIRADVTVTDILQPSFAQLGAGDPNNARISIRFSAPDLTGSNIPIRFDREAAIIECHSADATIPVTRLEFRANVYTAVVPKGRVFTDRLPTYYWCNMRVGETQYTIARVPLVHTIYMREPAINSLHFPDEDVRVVLESDSYFTLWSNSNPHFMFRHSNTVTTTELLADGTQRITGGRVAFGDHRSPQELLAPPIAPFAASGNAGYVYAVTRYEPDEYTIGPSHFMLSWESIAGAAPVPIRWR